MYHEYIGYTRNTMNTGIILKKLYKKCKKYANDSSYVYKLCHNKTKKGEGDRKWLVILKKLEETQTNEDRAFVSDTNCAKFRANSLKVIKIINTTKPNFIKTKIVNVCRDIETEYKVGDIVEPHLYEYDKNVICGGGIHYFKTLEPAYFYGKCIQNVITGPLREWYDNGQLYIKGQRENGKEEGEWIEYYENGNIREKTQYNNGEIVGERTAWHQNGIMKSCGEYKYGAKTGEWNYWDDGGKILHKGQYLNGLFHGLWINWNYIELTYDSVEYDRGGRIEN